MKEKTGYSYQEYEPTPDNPCEIKSKKIEGLNFLKTENIKISGDFKNDVERQERKPLIWINEEIFELYKYKTNWKELKKWLEETLNELKQNDIYDRTSYETGQIIATQCIIAEMQELESGNNE